MTGFLTDAIDLNDLRGCTYYEPYAGGAGAALGLIKNGAVSKIYLNDADKRIYAFWHAALHSSDHLVRRIRNAPLTIEEWHRQRDISENPDAHEQFEVGFAAFYMNRCNRSGVLSGSGPIGGYKQTGPWRIDVRFNRDALAERILHLARLKEHIHVSCKDAIAFLADQLPRGRSRRRVLVYLDPPYVNNSQRLYLNTYKANDHKQLACYLRKQKVLPWIMSYDDSALVRDLYSRHQVAHIPIRYTLQNKRAARELVIAPHRFAVPNACRIHGLESSLMDLQCRGISL